MGKLLAKKGVKAGLIISSPALRALHTAIIFGEQLGYERSKIVQSEEVYFSGIDKIMELIKQTPYEVDDLFVFGHNPDTLELVNKFAPTDFDNVPTSGVACIQFDVVGWNEISLENGKFMWLDFPSQHKKDK
jgi:phosphohistidine phosphatase